jgi:hypothetical protein
MNIDGSKRTQIAEHARQPCWDPGSQRVAFVPFEFGRFNILDYVSKGMVFHDVASGKNTPHPNGKIHHLYGLSWSGDGHWIVSTVHGGMGFGHAIIAVQVDGDAVHDLQIEGCRPCVSPDGGRVTWSRDDHTVCVGRLSLSEKGATVDKVVVIDHRDDKHLYHPDFSPDGKYITYSVGPGGRVLANGPGTHTQVAEMVGVRGVWDVYLRRADGTGPPIALTDAGQLSIKESDWVRSRP